MEENYCHKLERDPKRSLPDGSNHPPPDNLDYFNNNLFILIVKLNF